MTSILKNALFVFGLILLMAVAYFAFFRGDNTLLLSSNAALTGQAALETQNFLNRLQDLDKVSIDNSLFSDERFTSLHDFRTEFIDEPTGRSNPFAAVVE